jgi:hypothetical protein
MDALTYNASSLSIRETFEANYEGINRCNQALNTQLDQQIQLYVLLGEAKFLRAFMYFTW